MEKDLGKTQSSEHKSRTYSEDAEKLLQELLEGDVLSDGTYPQGNWIKRIAEVLAQARSEGYNEAIASAVNICEGMMYPIKASPMDIAEKLSTLVKK